MADEAQNNTSDPNEPVVEVSEQELADLGDFLAQVQIVLIGHEQRIGIIENAVFVQEADGASELSDGGDAESADGSAEAAEEGGAADAGGESPSDAS